MTRYVVRPVRGGGPNEEKWCVWDNDFGLVESYHHRRPLAAMQRDYLTAARGGKAQRRKNPGGKGFGPAEGC